MSWICPKCETENPDRLKVCEVCDSPRESSPIDILKEKLKKKYPDSAYSSFVRYHYDLLLSADNGDVDSQYQVGEWFSTHGNAKTSDDYSKIAVFWYQNAAMKGHLDAQIKLALCYEEGRGVPQIKDEAKKWYKRAGGDGNEKARQKFISLKYDSEIYKNVIKYRSLLLSKAEYGDSYSQFLLGEWLISHTRNPEYTREAIFWYTRAAKNGNIEAMFKLGEYYERNIDSSDAIKWYKKAAKEGNKRAQLKLAEAYLYGTMVGKDVKESLKWFEYNGGPISGADLCKIGHSYAVGDTVSIDMVKAVSYYRRAADMGDVVAQYKLGIIYEKGKWVEKDINAAKSWYKEAAAQGHEESKKRLSSIEYEIYSKDQEKKGCLTFLVTGIISLITLIILTNQPDDSWVHEKPLFDYEIGTALWVGGILVVYYISKNIFGYDD